MSQYDYSDRDAGGNQGAGWLRSEGREPGARRRKLAGYLKAANELRQSYQQSYSGWRNGQQTDEYYDGTPGAFPDAAVARSGKEELILFPSYARRHVKRKLPPKPDNSDEAYGQGREGAGGGDAEYWREEWERHEDEHAIVDVDVRGWLFTPHTGALNRKHRIFVGLARQLAGIQAPPADNTAGPSRPSPPGSESNSRAPSPGRGSHRERLQARLAQQEEEYVSQEAESIMRQGELEAARAYKGEYSEKPTGDEDDSVRNYRGSPQRPQLNHTSSTYSTRTEGGRDLSPSQKSVTRNANTTMSPAEMKQANSHLMSRLMPFLANPVANTTISVFFYNNEMSRQKTVVTDPSGHFTVRAALEFIPTHVRVLASDRLSVTNEVHITEPHGVSLISDIDDTIKHTAVTSGAREIFRNAFVRDLNELIIDGVKDWYNRLAELGVKFHYVSNSPWQLFPVLTNYFSLAGLPHGSFHLKQYSGMLQGIFEPVAERKKGTLDRIARDFPERRFILVGDSGEADLEVYTDFVLENPGRVLGVFIRDITTSPNTSGFFDSSMGPLAGDRNSNPANGSGRRNSSFEAQKMSAPQEDEDPELKAAIEASLREFDAEEKRRNNSSMNADHLDAPHNRPTLPPRRPTDPGRVESPRAGPAMGTLIDLSDDGPSSAPPTPPARMKSTSDLRSLSRISSKDSPSPLAQPPTRPAKPMSLRSASVESSAPPPAQSSPSKPPPPPKPRRSSNNVQNTPPATQAATGKPPPPKPPVKSATVQIPSASNSQQGYVSSARQKLSSVYNNLPSASAYWHGTEPSAQQPSFNNSGNPVSNANSDTNTAKRAPPPPPSRRAVSSYPAAAAQYAGSRISNFYNGTSNANAYSSNANQYQVRAATTSSRDPTAPSQGIGRTDTNLSTGSTQTLNKREELWRRRWARAQEIMRDHGVLLMSWRVGTDVMDESIKLVERALREEKEREKEAADELEKEKKRREQQDRDRQR